MKRARGSTAARRAGRSSEATARARVEVLFERVDLLTPDELARIGIGRMDHGDRAALLDHVASAARRSGRSELLEETRRVSRETLIERFASGGINPTWIALNWGVSQGSAEGRVAIIEAVEGAAAAAVVADVADPEVIDALSLDAQRMTSMAMGHAFGGSLERVLAEPARPEDGGGWTRWVGAGLAAVLLGSGAASIVVAYIGPAAGLAVFVVVTAVIMMLARRPAGAPAGRGPSTPTGGHCP